MKSHALYLAEISGKDMESDVLCMFNHTSNISPQRTSIGISATAPELYVCFSAIKISIGFRNPKQHIPLLLPGGRECGLDKRYVAILIYGADTQFIFRIGNEKAWGYGK